jgi:hypothetical protein
VSRTAASLNDIPAASASTSTDPPLDLPLEDQFVVIPGGSSRIQKFSVSVVTAFWLGVQSAIEKQPRLTLDHPENAISTQERRERSILDVLRSQPSEEFLDGMTLHLGSQIAACITDLGQSVLADLARIALRDEADPDALSHAMRWVGRLADPQSFQERLLALTRSLEAPSDIVRDGAALGLVALGSPAAIPALDAAVGRESNASLQEDLRQAATYLRSK